MQISALPRRVLQLVFTLSSNSTALTRPRLERRLAVSSTELNLALAELGRLGLLDPQRLRLTLPGLAVAAACRQASVVEAPIQLFSQRETPRAVA